jgi:hypothetical protein
MQPDAIPVPVTRSGPYVAAFQRRNSYDGRIELLHEAAKESSPELEALVLLALADDDEDVRKAGAAIAGEHGIGPAIPVLVRRAEDEEEYRTVRVEAAGALIVLGHDYDGFIVGLPPDIRRELDDRALAQRRPFGLTFRRVRRRTVSLIVSVGLGAGLLALFDHLPSIVGVMVAALGAATWIVAICLAGSDDD